MLKDKHDGNHLSQEAELDKGGLCTPVPKCRQYIPDFFGGLLETCK